VPVNYSQIDNLTGVCKEVLKRSTPSYANYNGGRTTDGQMAKIEARMQQETAAMEPIAVE
jgi:hypothetical protein